jgi:hypothetical protein
MIYKILHKQLKIEQLEPHTGWTKLNYVVFLYLDISLGR